MVAAFFTQFAVVCGWLGCISGCCLYIQSSTQLLCAPLTWHCCGFLLFIKQVADPECRAVAARAAKELLPVGNEGKTVPPKKADPATVIAALIAARNPGVAGNAVFGATLSYVAGLVASLQVSSSSMR